jgi:hypothetical protein
MKIGPHFPPDRRVYSQTCGGWIVEKSAAFQRSDRNQTIIQYGRTPRGFSAPRLFAARVSSLNLISGMSCHPERSVLQRSRKPALSKVEGNLLVGSPEYGPSLGTRRRVPHPRRLLSPEWGTQPLRTGRPALESRDPPAQQGREAPQQHHRRRNEQQHRHHHRMHIDPFIVHRRHHVSPLEHLQIVVQ